MQRVTILYGTVLVLLGLVSYFATGSKSFTALIPTFFGLPIVALGIAALQPGRRRHAMHGAMGLALLGFLGTLMGVPKLFALIGGTELARPGAAIAQSLMAFLSAVFLGLCIKSFLDARRGGASTAGAE